MHEQGQAFGVCLANKVSNLESKPAWSLERVQKMIVLDSQLCQVTLSLHLGSLKVHAPRLAHEASRIVQILSS